MWWSNNSSTHLIEMFTIPPHRDLKIAARRQDRKYARKRSKLLDLSTSYVPLKLGTIL